jgi:lysozyme
MILKPAHFVSAGLLAGCIAFTCPQEGERLHAYKDPVRPDLATICYGEAQNVHFGEVKTDAQCKQMLAKRMPDYIGPVEQLMPGLPDNRIIAYTDFSYNAGTGTLAHSRIPGFEKRHQVALACNELTRYAYAGHTILPGLVRRREKEKALCLKNIS